MDKDHTKIEIDDRRRRGDGTAAEAAPSVLPEGAPEQQSADAASAAGVAEPQAADWETQAAEYLELAQRREADLRNARARMGKELADSKRYAIEALLEDLFPALDGLSQAVDTYKDTPPGENPLLDGLRGTIRVLDKALSKHGISPINEEGVPFDANLHQPLKVEESADATEETVVEVYVHGYRLGDAVLKPAMVRIVKPPA